MRELMYLAVLEPSSDGGYGVFFPYLPGCISYGANAEEAIKNAKEALELHVYGMEKDGEKIPPSGMIVDKIVVGEGMAVFISIFPDVIANELDNRRVKTNVTIPVWLKEIAEKKGVNFSKILETSLIDYLGLKSKIN